MTGFRRPSVLKLMLKIDIKKGARAPYDHAYGVDAPLDVELVA
jgi:hypothetical protein